MPKIFLLGILFSSFLSPTLLQAESAISANENSIELKILSYNIKALPGLAGGYNKSRFTEIGLMLKRQREEGRAPDVVLLQESFVSEAERLRVAAEYPFVVKGPNAKDKDENGQTSSKLLGSGLFALSEHPITYSTKVVFGSEACKTWDCNSNKGVQAVWINHPKLPFYLPIANTHLQSNVKHEATRIEQINIINRFLKKWHLANSALIFVGDFNFRKFQESFKIFQRVTHLTHMGEVCTVITDRCQIGANSTLDEVVENNVDHQFARSGILWSKDQLRQHRVKFEPLFVERNYRELHEDKPLSDHLGYEVTYRLSWN